MDKRTTVLESIQKLLALGMPDREIIENLYDVGLSEEEALALIEEAKKPAVSAFEKEGGNLANTTQPNEVPLVNKERKLYDASLDKVPMQDQIAEQIPLAEKGSSSASAMTKTPGEKIFIGDSDGQKSFDQKPVLAAAWPKKTGSEVLEKKKSEEQKVDSKSQEQSIESLINKPRFAAGDSKKTSTITDKNKPFDDASKKSSVDEERNKSVVDEAIALLSKNESAKKDNATENSQRKEIAEKKELGEKKEIAGLETETIIQSPSNKVVEAKTGAYEKPKKRDALPDEVTPGYEEMWKKGIVVAVNTKLSEMKRIKEDIDSELTQKVEEAIRKELYQFKVLMDSQKELIASSNRASLEEKQREIVFIIDAKIAELKQHNKQLSESIMAIDASRAQQDLALKQVEKTLEEAKKSKSQLIIEMNSEMIKVKSSAQAFLDTASTHLVQMDQRISKALELERNIAEGMLAQAEQKIEQLTIQRADELIANLEVELNRLQTVSKKISPEMLEQKIQVLDEFRRQFLTNMQQSLSQINSAVEELNEKSIVADRALQEKTLAIDAKIEELTKFEKEFSSRLEEALKNK